MTTPANLEVRSLTEAEGHAAGAIAARALRDNAMMAYCVPDDPLARLQVSYDTFLDRVRPGVVGALLGPHVIGVAASASSDACLGATTPPQLRTTPDASPADAVGFDRPRHVISMMCRLDPEERHVHVGPVGVEPGAQGLGVGGAMMRLVCDRLDTNGELGWLETDKPENVVFYRRFGFDVDVEDRHLGFPVWFMRRSPR